MFDTMEEINRFNFINNLVDEVSTYGLVGGYFNVKSAIDPKNNGIYFACGYFADTVFDKENNFEKLYYIQQHDPARTRLDLYLMRITDNSPYAVHQAIISFALHSSTMKGIMNYVSFPVMLSWVQKSFVSTVEMIYVNATDKALTLAEREKYREILKEIMYSQGMQQYKDNGYLYNDDYKNVKPEKIRKIINKSPENMVPLNNLLISASHISKIITNHGHTAVFLSELIKHREIKFWKSQTVKTSLNVSDNEGYGSHILNNPEETTFIYDGRYRKEVVGIYLKTMFPEATRYSVEDIKNMGYGTCSVGVSINSLADIFQKAEKLKCPVAIDYKVLFFNCSKDGLKDHSSDDGLVTLRLPKEKKYIKIIDDILWANRNELLKVRILTPEDEKWYAHKMFGNNSWDTGNPPKVKKSDPNGKRIRF